VFCDFLPIYLDFYHNRIICLFFISEPRLYEDILRHPERKAIRSTFVDLVEATSEELDEENSFWGSKIQQLIGEGTAERGWKQEDVELLTGEGDRLVGIARTEMTPEF
jgi:hypothetical protein